MYLQACLSAREDRESTFHRCGGPVTLVQPCFCVGKTCFNHRGSAVNHFQACLSAREDREFIFHRCGGPLWLVQTCLCAGKP